PSPYRRSGRHPALLQCSCDCLLVFSEWRLERQKGLRHHHPSPLRPTLSPPHEAHRRRPFGVTARLSQAQLAQARIVGGPWAAALPMVLAVALFDREVVDAGVTLLHQPRRVVEPILVAVRTEPVAAVVTPLVSEADGDTVSGECPEFLDQAVIQFAYPLALQEGDDCRASDHDLA